MRSLFILLTLVLSPILKGETSMPFFQFSTPDITESSYSFEKLKNKKAILIVNTASECGFTPQYGDLQEIYEKFSSKGLEILAFPSNDFGGQEPGSNQDIASFCSQKGISFPLMSKTVVKGPAKSPIFNYLVENSPEAESGEIKWNFEKFLINSEGKVVARFRSATKPTDPQVVQAIQELLLAP